MTKESETFQSYCAMKAHFLREDYDYFKYCGRTKINNLEGRKDRPFFYRIALKYPKGERADYFLANMIDDPNRWVGEMNSDRYMQVKKKWVRLPEIFNNDCEFITQNYDNPISLFQGPAHEHPKIVRLVLQKKIEIETFMVFAIYTPRMLDEYDLKYKDFVWQDMSFRIRKYSPFLKQKLKMFDYDFREKCKEVIHGSQIDTV